MKKEEKGIGEDAYILGILFWLWVIAFVFTFYHALDIISFVTAPWTNEQAVDQLRQDMQDGDRQATDHLKDEIKLCVMPYIEFHPSGVSTVPETFDDVKACLAQL